jgi:hypothetical protein
MVARLHFDGAADSAVKVTARYQPKPELVYSFPGENNLQGNLIDG